MPLAYLSFAGAYIVFLLFPSMNYIYVASLIRGMAYIITNSFCMSVLPTLVPEGKESMAIALSTSLSNGILFFTSYAMSTTKVVLGTTQFTPTLILPIICFLIASLLQLIILKKYKPKFSKEKYK